MSAQAESRIDDELDPSVSDVDRVQRFRRRLEALLGIPASEGNELTLLKNGDQIFPAMIAAIRSATNTMDFLTLACSIEGWKAQIRTPPWVRRE